MKTPVLDLEGNLGHVFEVDDQHIRYHTFDDMLYPGQGNIFLSLEKGQKVLIKGREGAFTLAQADICEVSGDDAKEIKLLLEKHDETT